jgi:hypothetical protein
MKTATTSYRKKKNINPFDEGREKRTNFCVDDLIVWEDA